MQTNYTRLSNFRTLVVTVFLSLLTLGGFSIYLINKINLAADENLASDFVHYFEVSRPGLQEILRISPMEQAHETRFLMNVGEKIFQQAITFGINDQLHYRLQGSALHAVSPDSVRLAKTLSNSTASKFFFTSSDQGKIKPQLYLQLQNIFNGVVHLNPNLRSSQRFNVIYDHSGHILLATMTLPDKTLQAIRYTDSKGHTGYYTPSGEALFSSAFLKAPLKFTRISDGFSLNRYHPLLHITRPHYGIDYAAPTGTPIHAIGSGRVSFAGWGGGYGNAVVIRHSSQYQSLYAHMNHISYVIKPGEWVNKGQIIGFVGSTGLATGPHLHFGIYSFGKPINPATVLPKVNSPLRIAKRDLPDF